MRSLTRLSYLAYLLLALATPAQSQNKDTSLSPAAASYLRAALDTLQALTLDSNSLPWQTIRDSAFLIAIGAQEPRDAYGAVDWALHRANKHSFLQASRPGALASLVDGRYGYIHVPSRSGAGVGLADSLQLAIGRLEAAHACGWIVDLRGNGGGNVWPMLAGVGPLLGDSLVGAHGLGPTANRWYYHQGVSGILHPNGVLDTITRITVQPVQLQRPYAPVAVLIDEETGSSGEGVAIAFRGRANVRSFGSPSAGYTTVNQGSQLPDRALMVVTTGYSADRRGVLYTDRIEPDSPIPGPPPGWPFATDNTSRAAAKWLATQTGCRER